MKEEKSYSIFDIREADPQLEKHRKDVIEKYLEYEIVLMKEFKDEGKTLDDVLVYESNDDILLEEDFDLGKFFFWKIVYPPKDMYVNWKITKRLDDQEDFYIEPDFVYRELHLIAHYDEGNIRYLSVDKWRDADGDGTNDVNCLSTRVNVRNVTWNWLRDTSDEKDINLLYIFDHGNYTYFGWPLGYHSFFTVDSNRDGRAGSGGGPAGLDELILDTRFDIWLPLFTYGASGHGRLTFIIEACYIGHYIDILGNHPLQERIIITSTTNDTSAGGETGQDWPAFSHMLFKAMANGETDFTTAFNIADKHVNETNFLSIWGIRDWTGKLVPTNSKLDDNGDGIGHDYTLPNNEDGYLAEITGL